MGKNDIRIDAYISKSKDFTRPVLNHLRRISGFATQTIEWVFERKSGNWKYMKK